MMPAGEYVICDLCYVISEDDVWSEVCDLLDGEGGEHTLKDGRRIAIYSTEYGDGVYESSNGAQLGVDSGTIGCMLASDVRDEDVVLSEVGTVVTFAQPFETDVCDGLITFGHITVDTGDDTTNDDGDSEFDTTDDDFS